MQCCEIEAHHAQKPLTLRVPMSDSASCGWCCFLQMSLMTEQEWEQLQQAHLLGLQAKQPGEAGDAASAAVMSEEYVRPTFIIPTTLTLMSIPFITPYYTLDAAAIPNFLFLSLNVYLHF